MPCPSKKRLWTCKHRRRLQARPRKQRRRLEAASVVDAAAQDKADKEEAQRLQEMLRRPAAAKVDAAARADAAVVAAHRRHLQTGSFTSKRQEKTPREKRRPSSSMARSKTSGSITARLSAPGLREP
jgi:hypothetical protein